jgi:hypothetical protein
MKDANNGMMPNSTKNNSNRRFNVPRGNDSSTDNTSKDDNDDGMKHNYNST